MWIFNFFFGACDKKYWNLDIYNIFLKITIGLPGTIRPGLPVRVYQSSLLFGNISGDALRLSCRRRRSGEVDGDEGGLRAEASVGEPPPRPYYQPRPRIPALPPVSLPRRPFAFGMASFVLLVFEVLVGVLMCAWMLAGGRRVDDNAGTAWHDGRGMNFFS